MGALIARANGPLASQLTNLFVMLIHPLPGYVAVKVEARAIIAANSS